MKRVHLVAFNDGSYKKIVEPNLGSKHSGYITLWKIIL